MQYLVCLVDGEKDYTKVSDEQVEKLTHLIRQKKLPTKIKLGEKTIISETILGFTSDYEPPVSESSWSEIRDRVRASEWYKRAKGKPSEKRLPTVSLPNESLTFDSELPRGIRHISQSKRLQN